MKSLESELQIYKSLAETSCKYPGIHYYPDEPLFSDGVLYWLYNLLSRQYGELIIYAKVYAERLHGQPAVERAGKISSLRMLEGIYQMVFKTSQEFGAPVIPAVSGVFETTDGHRYVIPMMDLELTATGTSVRALRRDLGSVTQILVDNRLTGGILRSGDIGRGNYYFIADFALPYEPYYWQIMGKLMDVLVDETDQNPVSCRNIALSHSLGQQIMQETTLKKAQEIGAIILTTFPSLQSEERRKGLFYDPRWVAHRLDQGFNTLARITPAKGYKEPPRLIAEVY